MAAYQYIYVMKGLTKIYPGGRKVLENVWLSFLPGAKIGVLGHNGAGKSTLLKIMAGLDKDISGEAWAAEGVSIGFLQQEPHLDPKKDVLGNVMEGVGEAASLLKEFEEVSNAMADPDADFDTLLARRFYHRPRGRPRQYWIITNPAAIPPRWAKCATPACVPVTPRTSSIAPYTVTNSHAGIGIGGKIRMIMRRGNIMPNASSRPNTPPEAPSVG